MAEKRRGSLEGIGRRLQYYFSHKILLSREVGNAAVVTEVVRRYNQIFQGTAEAYV